MGFAQVEASEFHWLIGCPEAYRRHLALPQVPINDPHLGALLAAFGAL